jgi:RNA ligase (TIGR02306 family)
MSFFGVTAEEIKQVGPIDGADRIEVASLAGMDYSFVVGKGQFKAGDKVLYFPVDSIIPIDVTRKMGLEGKLSGKNKDRVKTIKLRGQISQGIVAVLDLVPAHIMEQGPEAITDCLGVKKYDPPEVPCHNAILKGLPDGVPVYDIESADRYVEVAARLMEQDVMVSEKVEGSNFSVLVTASGEVMVNQHNYTIIPKEGAEHTFWKVAQEQGIIDFAKSVSSADSTKRDVVVYGEMLGPGIQKNIYKLVKHKVLLFDVMANRQWFDPEKFMFAVQGFFGDLTAAVPILGDVGGPLSRWLGGKTIKEASNGKSCLADVLREGIVIKPMKEQTDPKLGRLFLKQRSPEYLAKEE